MGRKKNPDNKPRDEQIKEKLEAARQVSPVAKKRDAYEESKAKEAFGTWWTAARKSYDRPKDLEDVLWAHLRSTGHDKPELFEKGVEHFGLKK